MMKTGMGDRIQFLMILASEFFFRIRIIFKDTVMNRMEERKFWNGIISKNLTFIEKQVGGHCICKIFLWNGEPEGIRKIPFWGNVVIVIKYNGSSYLKKNPSISRFNGERCFCLHFSPTLLKNSFELQGP